jgi:hypothetical protein
VRTAANNSRPGRAVTIFGIVAPVARATPSEHSASQYVAARGDTKNKNVRTATPFWGAAAR